MIRAVIFDMYETLITHYSTPLYFSHAMASDMEIPLENFISLWRPTASLRSIGVISLEDILEKIMLENNCYDARILEKIVQKRIATKEDCFNHLHPEIIPMLENIRKKGIKIGLISNCFSEEADVIEKSILYPYFDVPYLSYRIHLEKPDPQIFTQCADQLGVSLSECLYIGDGGSQELETARQSGMLAMQCIWYFNQENHPGKIKEDFQQLENPLQLLPLLDQL